MEALEVWAGCFPVLLLCFLLITTADLERVFSSERYNVHEWKILRPF